jgi:hypothetical protein
MPKRVPPRLVGAGVLAEAGSGPTAGRPERLYRLVSDSIGVAVEDGSASAATVAASAVSQALHLAEREMAAGMEAGILDRDGETVRPGRRFRARLRPSDVAGVKRAVATIERVFRRRRQSTEGTPVSWTHVFLPLVEKHPEGTGGTDG